MIKRFLLIVLSIGLLIGVVSPVMGNQDSNTLNRELELNDSKPAGFEKLIEKAKKSGVPLALNESTKNDGKIKINVTKQKVVNDQNSVIDGTAVINVNELKQAFRFEEQALHTFVLPTGEEYHVMNIDTNVERGQKTYEVVIHYSWITGTDKEYASVSIGNLQEGVNVLTFGNPFETAEFLDIVQGEVKNYKSQEGEVSILAATTPGWQDVNHKNTIQGKYGANGQDWGRSVVATIGSYKGSGLAGEVQIRVWGTRQDMQNTTGVTVYSTDRLRTGVTHQDGLVNRAYPSSTDGSTSTQASVVYDVLSLFGVPTNSVELWANSLSAQVIQNTTGLNNLEVDFYRYAGLGSSTELPSNIATNNADSYYNMTTKGVTARFSIENYGQFSQVQSYAQARYVSTNALGQVVSFWSEKVWYYHYL